MHNSFPSHFFKGLVLTAVLPISTSLLLISMGKALASGDFSRTCQNIKLYTNRYMGRVYLNGDCRMRDGNIDHFAAIDLGDYITNNDGKILWSRDGNFQDSCTPPKLFNSHILGTTCRKRNGQYVYGEINLNEHIANIDGELKYD